MKRAFLALCILLVCAPACVADLYWQSTFNNDTVMETTTPAMWTWKNEPKPSIVDATAEGVTFGTPDEIVRCVRFNEYNVAVPPVFNNNPRATIYRGFPWQIAGVSGTGGTVVLEFDVRFATEHNEGFVVRLTGHDATSSDPTSVRSQGVGLQFTGNYSYAAGGSTYGVQLQTKRAGPLFMQLKYSDDTPVTYSLSTWYSVKIEARMTDQMCRVWFAPKGEALVNISKTAGTADQLDGWQGWMPSQGGSSIPAGTIVANLHNAAFSLVRMNTAEGIVGKVVLDNVKLTIPQDPIGSSASDLRLADKGAYVNVSDAIVTAGPGVVGTKLYIQDNTSGGAGTRVLPDDTVIALGDKVTVKGIVQQTSDNGSATVHVGEREIAASMITVQSHNNTLPLPVIMTNKNVGGGWFGPDEAVSPVPEPRLKGVWPANTSGDSDYNVVTNSFAPLFNVGTRVAVTGRVTKRLLDYELNPLIPTNLYPYDIYIDDGSLADDGWRDSTRGVTDISHPAGIRIRMTQATFSALYLTYGDVTGWYVTVKGIVSATSGTDLSPSVGIERNIRGVRMLSDADLAMY